MLRCNDKFTRIFDYHESATTTETTSSDALWNFEEDRENFRELLSNLGEVNEFDTVFSTSAGTLLNVTLSGKNVELDGEHSVSPRSPSI